MLISVYILALNGGQQYYVGGTRGKVSTRVRNMKHGIDVPAFIVGKAITDVDVLACNVLPIEEFKWTIEVMSWFGMSRVRGACYSNLVLSVQQTIDIRDTLENWQAIKQFDKLCTRCTPYLIS